MYQFVPFRTGIQKKAIPKPTTYQQSTLITKRMKVDDSQLNIFNPKSGHSPAELDSTGDPDGTSAPVVHFKKRYIKFVSYFKMKTNC
jgi:hypothetical protein